MTVVMTLDLPVTREDLEALSAEAGSAASPPDGLIVHTATVTSGGVRVVNAWENQAQFEKFLDDRLMASLQKVAAEKGHDVSGPPEPTFEEAFDVVKGR
jgi:hypothetical protein